MPDRKDRRSKKSAGAAAAAGSSVKRSAKTVDPVRQAVDRFKSAMVSREALSYDLDKDRIARLQLLLAPIACTEAHTELLKLAHRLNDADAIHVLLRAELFAEKQLDIFQCIKFHAMPFYYKLDGINDTVAFNVSMKLLLRFQAIVNSQSPEELRQLIKINHFNVHHFHDEYFANAFLTALEQRGQELRLNAHRQHLLVHASQREFKGVMNFCLESHILPDVVNIPLVGNHAALAYYLLSPQANKAEIREYFRTQWRAEYLKDINDVCAFELLAVCDSVGEVDDIKQELKLFLSDKPVSAIIRQVLRGELVLVIVQKNPEFTEKLSSLDYQHVIKKTRSASLFNFVCTESTVAERFNVTSCLMQVIEEFNNNECSVNGLDIKRVHRHYANFFEGIVDAIIHRNDPGLDVNLRFIFAICIQENRINALIKLAGKFKSVFEECVKGGFSADASLRRFRVDGFSPLKVALVNNSRSVVVWLYHYMCEYRIEINRDDIVPLASDLLECLLSDAVPDVALIAHCLEDFSGLYCDFATIKKLLNLGFNQDPVNMEFLSKVVKVAAPYFNSALFNFYHEQGFSSQELEWLAAAFEILAAQQQVLYSNGSTAMHIAHYLQEVKQDPFQDMTEADSDKIRSIDLYGFFPKTGVIAEDEQEKLADLLIRRMFYLYQQGQCEQLKQELMKEHVVTETNLDTHEQHSSACTVMGLLCHYGLDNVFELTLLLCPDLGVSKITVAGQFSTLFTELCKFGKEALARKLQNYLRLRGDFTVEVKYLEEQISPRYVVLAYGCESPYDQTKREISALPKERYQHEKMSDATRLGCIAYVHQFFTEHDPVIARDIVSRIATTMSSSMLEVAIAQQDSLLVLIAIVYELKGVIAADQRDRLIKVLLLSPDRDLAQRLQLTEKDILQQRDYSEKGCLSPVDGLTICLLELEFALQHKMYILAEDYCQLLCHLVTIIQLSAYQLSSVLHLLIQFKRVLPEDKHNKIRGLGYKLLVKGKVPLEKITLHQELLEFVVFAINTSFPRDDGFIVEVTHEEDAPRLIEIKRYLDRATIDLDRAMVRQGKMVGPEDDLRFESRQEYQQLIFNLYRANPSIDFMAQGQYQAAAVCLYAGAALSADLTVLQLCQVLKAADFLPSIHRRLREAIKARVLSRPSEVNGVAESPSPLQVLISSGQWILVDLLLGFDQLQLTHTQKDTKPYLVQMCQRGCPSAILDKFCKKISKSLVLNKILLPCTPGGSSPLYVFYRATGMKKCADFLVGCGDKLTDHGDISIIELLALTQEWLEDVEFASYKAPLQKIALQLIAIIKKENINYVSAVREYAKTDSAVLLGLKTALVETIVVVDGYHLDWLFNVALSQLNFSLLKAVCDYKQKLEFLFDLNAVVAWVDKAEPSTPLKKLSQLLAAQPRNTQIILESVQLLLPLANVTSEDIQEDIMSILKQLIVRRLSVATIMKSARPSAEYLKSLVRCACDSGTDVAVLEIVNYYGELYPCVAMDILYEHDDLSVKLLKQVSALKSATIIAGLVGVIDERYGKFPAKLIDLLVELTEMDLTVIQPSVERLPQLFKVFSQVLSFKQENKKGSFKAFLQNRLDKNIDEINKGLIDISQQVDQFAMPTSLEQCPVMMTAIDNTLKSLKSLVAKTKGLEQYVREDAYQVQLDRIEGLELSAQDKKSAVTAQQKIWSDVKAVEELAKQQAQQKKLDKQRQAEEKLLATQERLEEERAREGMRQQVAADKQAELAKQQAKTAKQKKRVERKYQKREQQQLAVQAEQTAIEAMHARIEEQLITPLSRLEHASKDVHLNGSVDLLNLKRLKQTIEGHLHACRDLLEQVKVIVTPKDQKFVHQILADVTARINALGKILSEQLAEVNQRGSREAARLTLEKQQQEEQERLAQESEAAEESRYQQYEETLTQQLRKQAAERMKNSSRNPYAQFAIIAPDTIVAIVPRARLVRDERGLKIEFTGEKRMSIDVGDDNCLYVVNSSDIQEGRCCLSYHAGQWTILQKDKVFTGYIVKPLYAVTDNLRLRHAERVITIPGFIPGLEQRPAAVPALTS